MTRHRSSLLLCLTLLLTSALVHAQRQAGPVPELLEQVDPYRAQRLAEYNSVFLQEALYTARRYRIVQANIDLLLIDDDFTITPFEDVAPIRITQESVQRTEDVVYWHGRVQTALQPQLDAYGINIFTSISIYAWDLDESGTASPSLQNRFTHSPSWRIDESGVPVLETVPEGEAGIVGPPPQTPGDIERHRRLKNLERHAFYSATAEISLPEGARYVLMPLEYTPKYSVIYEVDRDKVIQMLIDPLLPGEVDTRSESEKLKVARYNALIESLPKEVGKPVREDIE